MDKVFSDIASFLVIIFVIILDNSVVGSRDKFYCYGDICNSGQDTQFCSTTFRYCRSCADIVGSCGKPDQPINCTSYCVEHLTEMKWKEKGDDKCFFTPNVTNSVMNGTNSTKAYDRGNALEILCNPGYRLEYSAVAHCGPFGEFRYQAPTCKEISCRAPPLVPNGNINKPEKKMYYVGDNISYECDKGYTLYGISTLTCTVDGVWAASSNVIGPVCLQDKTSEWMYVCIVLAVVVILFFVQLIWRLKGKYTSIMPSIVETFGKLCRRNKENIMSETDAEARQPLCGMSQEKEKEIKPALTTTATDPIENNHKDPVYKSHGCIPFRQSENFPTYVQSICRKEISKSDSTGINLQRLTHSISPKKDTPDIAAAFRHDNIILKIVNESDMSAFSPDKGVIQASTSTISPTECTGETVVPQQPESGRAGHLNFDSLCSELNPSDNYQIQMLQTKQITYTHVRPSLQRSISAPQGQTIHVR